MILIRFKPECRWLAKVIYKKRFKMYESMKNQKGNSNEYHYVSIEKDLGFKIRNNKINQINQPSKNINQPKQFTIRHLNGNNNHSNTIDLNKSYVEAVKQNETHLKQHQFIGNMNLTNALASSSIGGVEMGSLLTKLNDKNLGSTKLFLNGLLQSLHLHLLTL